MDHHTSRSEDTTPSGLGSIADSIKTTVGSDSTPAIKFSNTSANTNFDKIVETATSYEGINVSLYKSRETGLKVLVANVEIPVVCLRLNTSF
jgi:hypothetical protein